MPTNPSPDPMDSMWAFIAVLVRVFRHRAGMTGDQLAKVLNSSKPSVSRLENNLARLEERQAEALDKHFGTTPLFVCLVRYATRGHDPEWFKQHTQLEQISEIIRSYEALVIPGLLQTKEYAEEMVGAFGAPGTEDRLQERIDRQKLLDREYPPALMYIVSQNALDWVIGSPEIHKAQLQHLLDLAESGKVAIRVLPRTAGAHVGMDGSFKLMSGGYGDVAYTESSGIGRLVGTASEVRSYAVKYERISFKALDESASRTLIRRIMEEL
ncbi:helix-turn-helix domain-containing protein [Actinocorallia sp. API 0066]|uniref:helix-turn-helix domain-containing protein n=1 Tax=Actinocorallia sp. API 0066 TaxID=2896846 RepID=UPI001E65DC4C|nr:helix-turn-helix transcriptional regulator [Actinocorallia sp. API 0066]MCD0448865.1 helix-turn-helix domain-containing protein [Actinocorallia sp. API 0066]